MSGGAGRGVTALAADAIEAAGATVQPMTPSANRIIT